MKALRDTTTPARKKDSTTEASRSGKAVLPSCEIKLTLEKSSRDGNIWLVTAETTLRHTDSSRTLLADKFAAVGYTNLGSRVVALVTGYVQKTR